MPCQEIQSWTFKGLVAAFVDLAVAYFLLCASALVYITSKFLGLFGLSLPCPCDGLFSDPSKNKCFQEVLGNLPVKKISAVQGSAKSRIPFDSNLCKEQHRVSGDELDGETCNSFQPGKGIGDMAGEEDSSWNENGSGLDLLSAQSLKKGSYQIKGKRYTVNRSPCGLRYRWKVGVGHKKFLQSPSSMAELVNTVEEKDSLSVNSEEGRRALEKDSFCKSISLPSGGCETGVRNKQPERTLSWAGENRCSSPVDLTFDGNAQKTIRILEQALEEERVAHAALALELEKERNAAATAADEAMAMIQRLQEEKASIGMEARQNQRMIEEKSAFDAEEMSILKEILLRREKEKHFLEKEVETYRQILLDIEEPKSSLPDAKADLREDSLLSHSTECVEQTPQPMTMPFNEKDPGNMEIADFFAGPGIISNQTESCFLGFENESMVPGYDYNADSLKAGEVHRSLFNNSGDEAPELNQSNSEGIHVHEKTKTLIDGEQKEREDGNAFPKPMSKASDRTNPETIVQCGVDKEEKGEEDSYDVDCHVHDVYVITDDDSMSDKVQVNIPSAYAEASEAVSSAMTRDLKLDRSRSVSDTTYKLPPVCPPRQKNMSPDMRRKSMSAVDYERLKLENEVGWLRGRLRAIQKGRENLSQSIGGLKEQGKTELQLLEGITRQPRDVKQLTEARRSVRHGSLRHPSSMVKVMSKKRPSRSVTLDQHSA